MRRKLLAALAVTVGLLTACGSPMTNNNSGAEQASEQRTEIKETEKKSYDSKDGLPPVNEDLKQFYREAETHFLDIVFLRLKCDKTQTITEKTDEGDVSVVYGRVTDARYPTLAKLREMTERYFTAAFTEELLTKEEYEQPRFREYDGELYMIQMMRSGNIQYAGHVFEDIETDGTVMKMPVKVYYALNATPYEYFYETPEDLAAYRMKEYVQVLTKEDNGWRFSRFELFY